MADWIGVDMTDPTLTALISLDAPADATRLHEWEAEDGTYARGFIGTERVLSSGATIRIVGTQWADGRVERCIVTDSGAYTTDEAYELARCLTALAQELRGLTLETLVVA